MKKFFKHLGLGLGGLLVLSGVGLTGVQVLGPRSRPASPEKVEATAERIERGRYLAHHVGACFSCHGQRDTTSMSQHVVPGTEGFAGGCDPDFPGKVCFSNISSHPTAGLGGWTDGEVMRAIREGLSRDGRSLAPLMPYESYRSFSDEDTRALVAYLRTLPASAEPSPVSELPFPLSVVVKLIPSPLEGAVAHPSPTDTVAYGRYLTTVSGCGGCHGDDFAGGGLTLDTPMGPVVAANITPDVETGIGQMTRENFIFRFKAYQQLDPSLKMTPQTVTYMPWGLFAGMTEADLGAIYDYLRTVPAVRKQVIVHPQPREVAAN
jgi:mono/diheme cytochrome c family protein